MRKIEIITIKILALCLIVSCSAPEVEIIPETETQGEYVNLINQQSELKPQGGRGTCIVFAAVAAVEANLKRKGFGEVDLSEEFVNYARKAFYIHPVMQDYVDGRKTENQLGSQGGGGGFYTASHMLAGLKVPKEVVMPYQTSNNYYTQNYPILNRLLNEDEFKTQFNYNTFNLNPEILTDDLLRGEHTWYSVTGVQEIIDPRQNIDQIENALRNRNEVIIDFRVPVDFNLDENNTWRASSNDSANGAHSVLLVGFDKRNPDASKHYFIVKNSWGNVRTDKREEYAGYTTFSYDFIQKNVTVAGFIKDVKTLSFGNDGFKWPELKFIGRWKTVFHGQNGTLDIYNIPGLNDAVIESHFQQGRISSKHEDYRIGTYYDENGTVYRVNGKMEGNKLTFSLNYEQPILPWEEPFPGIFSNEETYARDGYKKFTFYLDKNNFMGGYATKGEYYSSAHKYVGGFATKMERPNINYTILTRTTPSNYLQRPFKFYSELIEGDIYFDKTSLYSSSYFEVSGQFISENNFGVSVKLLVPRDANENTIFKIVYPNKELRFECKLAQRKDAFIGILPDADEDKVIPFLLYVNE
ncbi:hypothetical protein B4Q04_15060 [Zobellia sp. OII3]|uniref:C1 family peptidase n=1 Tax=Zobellia sp. OII3 TaxID=2034520 RepID=UPI000B52F7E9|nr:C1 family peptidase [Zobellia sp. OII3]OWW24635.1 hypothetical protein B4Q04_15060 [Zobellia sp. OII3]